jgi:Uma2 family endonuclease
MTVELKHLTYEAYLALPEMKARYSIVDGELVVEATPTPSHQALLLELLLQLSPFVRERHLGKIFAAPVGRHRALRALWPRHPDCLAGVARAASHGR